VKNLTRKPRPAAKVLTLVAQAEEAAWQAELAARKAARPLPTKPHWAAKAARWSA
jgi:hypothetical protein